MKAHEPHHIPDFDDQEAVLSTSLTQPLDSATLAPEFQPKMPGPRALARAARNRLEEGESLGELAGVSLTHRFKPDSDRRLWLVDFEAEAGQDLTLSSGSYTLLAIGEEAGGTLSSATRLCALPPHPGVLTVEALSQYGSQQHIWLEAAAGGTLQDLLDGSQKLSLAETAWLSQELAEGLDYLHRNGMSFKQLSASSCVFTGQLRAALLPPSQDNRGIRQSEEEALMRRDIQAFAALLWRCVMGEPAPDQQNRLPLNVLLPEVSSTTAETFEKALEADENIPTVFDLAMTLCRDATPQIPALYATAPEVSRWSLPPLEGVPTREDEAKNVGRRALARRPDQSLRRSKPKKTAHSGSGLKKLDRRLLTGGAILSLLLVAGAVFALGGLHLDEVAGEETPAPQALTEPAETGQPQGAVQAEQKASASATAAAEPAGKQALDAQQVVAETLNLRNRAFAENQADLISDYALAGAKVEELDRQALERNSSTKFARLELVSVEKSEQDGDKLTVRAIVRSPVATESTGLSAHVFMRDGLPHQRVLFIFQQEDSRWLLEQALPQES